MRKLLITIIVFTAGLAAQTSNYPTTVDTDSTLFVTADNVQSTLTLPMTTGSATMSVQSSAGFAVNMIATVCDTASNTGKCAAYEHMLITNIVGQVLSVTRGFAGSSARAHSAGKLVSVLIDAAHQQSLKSAVVAIETALGPNLQNVTNGPQAYDWIQTPGGSLIQSGVNQPIVLSPCPKGIKLGSTWVPVYLKGGTGTAEPVTPTGGTCTSGAASGTITVTPANAHSGAWTVQSATAGIQEAAHTASVGGFGSLTVPAGNWHIYATITLPAGVSIAGTGTTSTFLTQDFTSGDLIYSNGAYSISISHLSMGPSAAVTSGYAIHLTGYSALIDDIVMLGNGSNYFWGGIHADNTGTGARVSNVLIGAWAGYGIYITGGSAVISNLEMSTTQPSAIGVYLHNSYVYLSTFSLQNGAASGAGPNRAILIDGASGESTITNGETDGWAAHIVALGTSPTIRIGVSNVSMTGGTGQGSGIYTGPQVAEASFSAMRIGGLCGNPIVQVDGSKLVSFSGVDIYEATCASIGFRVGYLTASDSVSITNSRIGRSYTGAADSNMDYAIQVVAGATDNIIITGNDLSGAGVPLLNASTASPLHAIIKDNLGIDNIVGTITIGTGTAAFPLNPTATLNSTAAVSAVSGLWAGARGSFVNTNATPGAWSAGATIGNTLTPTQNVPVIWTFDGTKIWLK